VFYRWRVEDTSTVATLRKQFGKKIRSIRKRHNMTQEQFAELLDISVDFLSLIERGLTHLHLSRSNPVQPNFGIRIKKLRFDRGMCQQDLADLCELSVEQVSNIERVTSWTDEVSLALLASAFSVLQKDLLDYTENDAFIRASGLKWRASRKNRFSIRGRKIQVTVPRREN